MYGLTGRVTERPRGIILANLFFERYVSSNPLPPQTKKQDLLTMCSSLCHVVGVGESLLLDRSGWILDLTNVCSAHETTDNLNIFRSMMVNDVSVSNSGESNE